MILVDLVIIMISGVVEVVRTDTTTLTMLRNVHQLIQDGDDDLYDDPGEYDDLYDDHGEFDGYAVAHGKLCDVCWFLMIMMI